VVSTGIETKQLLARGLFDEIGQIGLKPALALESEC